MSHRGICGSTLQRLLTFEVRFPPGDYLRRRGTIGGLPYFEINPPPSIAFERMHRGLRTIPGAEAVAGVSAPLLNSLVVPSATVSLDGRPARGPNENGGSPASFAIGVGANASHLDERRTLTAAYFLVTPDFFTVIRSPKLRGRDFNEQDTAGGEWVAIVNESAARRFWPESDPLGQTFTILNSPEERPRKVIGIVARHPPDAGRRLQTGDLHVVPAATLHASIHWRQHRRTDGVHDAKRR